MALKESPLPNITGGYATRFGFPYRTTLSFQSLIRRLEERAADPFALEAMLYEQILKTVKEIPALLKPIEDLEILKKYRKEADLLLATVLPTSMIENYVAGIIVPFQPITVYASPRFKEMLVADEDGVWDLSRMDVSKGINELIAYAGMAILEKYYGFKIMHPDVMKSKELDKMTGLTRFYQPEINTMFAEVIALKEPKPLSEIDLSPLKDDFFNASFWLEHFPPDTFEFRGITVYRMMDITDRELISQIEYILLQSGSIISKENISEIEEKFRNFFKIPDIRVGLAPIFSYRGQMANCNMESWFCLIPPEKASLMLDNFENSIYHTAVERAAPYLVDDLEKLPSLTCIEQELLREGIRSIIVVPVFHDKDLIGAIEIGCPRPNELNFVSMLKVKEILPLIAVAFQRAAKDFDTQVQATIKEHFTSIHPSVEWKFSQAALELIRLNSTTDQTRIAPIELKDVMPIYGQVDIRGSSERRNEAIREDLIEYLNAAKRILQLAYKAYPLSILDEMIFRADKYISKLQDSLDSGDETGILEFMKQEVEPTFRLLAEQATHLKLAIESYFTLLDPEHEIYHFRRQSFEKSLTMINDVVARMLEEEEARTQLLLPHYFEKYKTDGVEYNIYLGQSILQEGKFDPVYVKNFRLWQLITMVNIARETHQLIPELPMPLETTQLILCYSNPFAIMFRMDEKRFDVAGAYNIRYEIVKKRIDKALIKGTNERLTQPHKIAVIYTQEKEAKEYERYFEFMRSKGWITGMHEHVELEPLQGLQGLKALRVQIRYDQEEPKLNYDEEELFRQVKDVMVQK
jgi:GAF domain-containing protein